MNGDFGFLIAIILLSLRNSDLDQESKYRKSLDANLS